MQSTKQWFIFVAALPSAVLLLLVGNSNLSLFFANVSFFALHLWDHHA